MSRRLALVLALAAAPFAGCSLGDQDGDEGGEPARPPQLGATGDDEQAVVKLGFPSLATKNTIRVGGGDAAADVAGVTSMVFPATSEASRPSAVVLVDEADWQAGVTASVLTARPIGAPLLLSAGPELPAVTEDTLERLNPRGSDLSRDAQVIRIGDRPPSPPGRKTAVIRGRDPYERAAAIDRFSSTAKGKPSRNVVVASGERPEYAMPAAAWAARSGDSVLLTRKDGVPSPTMKAIRTHERPDIYILGPESVIGPAVERELRRVGRVRRIEGPTPVQNAIAFARYRAGSFGWGIVVPGFNFTLASTTRPLDAAASAPLAARGVFAPLLLTDNAERLPRLLEGYFLDVQPGYEEDPSKGVYNRVWILGDDKTISIPTQGRIDEITELVPVEVERP